MPSRLRPSCSRRDRPAAARTLATALASTLILGTAAASQFIAPTPAQADTVSSSSAANPAVATAAATAQAKLTGKSVAIPALTTPTETVAADSSGSLTLTQSLYPTRVKQAGSWKSVDPALHVTSDGGIEPTAVPSGVTLSGGGSGPLASLTSFGKQLTISWPGTLPKPTLSGSTATYAEVLPGVDLQATVSALGGFSEVLVVKNADAAANPKLATLTLGTHAIGLSVSGDKAGNLKATDPTGAAFFTSPTAMMWDSSSTAPATTPTTSPSSATSRASHASLADTPSASPSPTAAPGSDDPAAEDGPGLGAQTAQIPASVSAGKLTLTPDSTVLHGPATHYPVYIDPTWNPAYASDPKQAYDEIQQGCPDKNALNSSTAPYDTPGVGLNAYSGCIGIEEAFFQFKMDSRLTTSTAKIINATFKATEVYAASLDCSRTSNVQVRLAGAIGTSTSWNSRPGLLTVQDTKSFGSTCTTNPSQGFDVTNAFIQGATAKPAWPSVTLGMIATDESEKLNFRRFANNPTVTVQYDTVPVVSSATTSPSTVCAGSTALGHTSTILNAYLTDADQGAPIQAKFSLIGKDGTGKIVYPVGGTSPVTATPSNTVTANGTIRWGVGYLPTGTYTWTAQADDGKYTSPVTTCHFAVDATAPGAPTITSPVFDNNGIALERTPAEFDFDPPVDATGKPATDIDHYAYSWGTPPPTVNPPLTVAAAAGTTKITLTPGGVLHNTLYVYAVDKAGNQSASNHYDFTTTPSNVVDPTGDLSGDGKPDLIVPGTDGDVRLYQADGKGGLAAPVTISRGGVFAGAKLTTGGFRGYGEQDVLAITSDGQAHIYYGNGDAEPLPSFAPSADQVAPVPPELALLDTTSTFTWAQVTQVVAAEDGTGNPPNLWALTTDGTLWWIPGTFTTGIFDVPIQLATGWTGRTLAFGGMSGGYPALWSRDPASGELDLYTTGADTAPAGAITSVKTVVAANGWTAAAHPQIFSAGTSNTDTAGTSDGKPDLWSTTPDVKRGLWYSQSTATASMTAPKHVQNLQPSGDVSGEGYGDASIIYNYSSGQITAFNAASTLTGAFTWPAAGWTAAPGTWKCTNTKWIRGDYNGDGRTDLAALCGSASEVSLWTFITNASGTYNAPVKSWSRASGWTFAYMNPIAGDYNGDGRDDLAVLYGYADGHVTLFTIATSASGTFLDSVASWTAPVGAWGFSQMKLVAGDFNADNRDDLGIMYGYGDGGVGLFDFPATAQGLFTGGTRSWYDPPGNWGFGQTKLVAGDFDGDGHADVAALYGYASGEVGLFSFLSDTSGNFTRGDTRSWDRPTGWGFNQMVLTVGGFTSSGRDDIGILYGYGDASVALFTLPSDTTGAFSEDAQSWKAGPGAWTFSQMTLL